MPKKPNETSSGTIGLAAECHTFISQGMSLLDKPAIQRDLWEAVKLFASATDEASKEYAASLFPEAFLCSHCNMWHAIDWDGIKKNLFGPGGLDFAAAHDELKAILNFKQAAEAGKDWNNATNVNSDENLKEMIKPTEAATDGTDSGTEGTQPGNGQ